VKSPNVAAYVYVGNSDSQDIIVFALLSSGDLVPVETVAVPGPAARGGSLPMAVSPDKKFLFAGLRNEPYSVAAFAIDGKAGTLTLAGRGSLVDSMCCIVTDCAGKFLIGASYGGSRISVNPIGMNGVVAPVQQVIPERPNAHCIAVDPSNRYVLSSSLGSDAVYQDKFDANTGRLVPNDPPAIRVHAKAGPRHLVFSPDAKFVYLVNELDATICVFPWDDKSGTLKSQIQIISALPGGFSGKPWAADIHMTPDGQFLYASERTSSTLAAFRVDLETGVLTVIDFYPTETQPRAFNIDPSGRYLLAAGQLSNSLTVHAIDGQAGKLRQLKRYSTGRNPNWVEIIDLP
jgi:6-phosphogluconolactonase